MDIETTPRTRIVIGNCPRCGCVIAYATEAGQAWPLLSCRPCEWTGATSDLWNHHYFEDEARAGVTAEAPQPCPQGRYPFSQ